MTLKQDIEKFLNVNQKYYKDRVSRERVLKQTKSLSNLYSESSKKVLTEHKTAIKILTKIDKQIFLAQLYEKVLPKGYRGSASSEKSLMDFATKHGITMKAKEKPINVDDRAVKRAKSVKQIEASYRTKETPVGTQSDKGKDEKQKIVRKFYRLYLSFFTNPLTEEQAKYQPQKKRRSKIGLKHYEEEEATEEGVLQRFQLEWELDDNHAETVETQYDLPALWHSGQMIQHFEQNNLQGKLTKGWKEFFESLEQSPGREFNQRLDTFLKRVRYIRVDMIDPADEMRGGAKPDLLLKQKNYRENITSAYPWVSIEYDKNAAKDDLRLMFKPIVHSKFLKENQIPNACAFDILIEAYEESWNKQEKKRKTIAKNRIELTYDYLKQLFGIDLTETDMGLSIDLLIEKWFRPKKLALVVFDATGDIISRYHPQDDKNKLGKLSPKTLYLLATNSHLQRCNQKLKTLEQISSGSMDVDDVTAAFNFQVSEHFALPKQCKVPHRLITKFEDFADIDLEEIEGDNMNLTVQTTPLIEIYSYLKDVCHHEPQIDVLGNDIITSLTFKAGHINVKVRTPDSDKISGKLKFNEDDNQRQYEEFQKMKFEMNESVMNMDTMSQYNDIDILTACAPKALICKLHGDENMKSTHYVDMIKAYTQCLMIVKHFCVANKFDQLYDYSEYKGQPLRDNFLYIVRRDSTNTLSKANQDVLLKQSITVFRGEELKFWWQQIKDNVTIVAVL